MSMVYTGCLKPSHTSHGKSKLMLCSWIPAARSRMPSRRFSQVKRMKGKARITASPMKCRMPKKTKPSGLKTSDPRVMIRP